VPSRSTMSGCIVECVTDELDNLIISYVFFVTIYQVKQC
jgi:hypothetical protein